ncbi:hypothetical protein [Tenacibaculum sp. M341]|uniref:hypothetical protein n=1 Tax=Tenacibaculum sp. M341 TaxID=2530339 RepID=UPI001049532D|nr:hypothetical protein [Tenacibaculum sp. M341]TCI93686.1 hypothetical protein EYW44_04530 [Tenacibaculum sp. M341]
MWYKIDFNRWAIQLLPTYLRKPKIQAFLKVLMTPINKLYDEFLKARKEDAVFLTHNSQVCYLRKALNDTYDKSQRRINIIDGNKFARRYVYTRVEQRPVFFGKIFINSRDQYADTGVDFMVEIPSEVKRIKGEIEIRAFINRFNAATKRYNLIEK